MNNPHARPLWPLQGYNGGGWPYCLLRGGITMARRVCGLNFSLLVLYNYPSKNTLCPVCLAIRSLCKTRPFFYKVLLLLKPSLSVGSPTKTTAPPPPTPTPNHTNNEMLDMCFVLSKLRSFHSETRGKKK